MEEENKHMEEETNTIVVDFGPGARNKESLKEEQPPQPQPQETKQKTKSPLYQRRGARHMSKQNLDEHHQKENSKQNKRLNRLSHQKKKIKKPHKEETIKVVN